MRSSEKHLLSLLRDFIRDEVLENACKCILETDMDTCVRTCTEQNKKLIIVTIRTNMGDKMHLLEKLLENANLPILLVVE